MALLLACVLGPPAALGDEEMSDKARDAYAKAQRLYGDGGRKNLEKAFRLLNVRKDDALGSVDFWELYARVWLALDKVPRYLWEKTIGPRQERAPASPVFDLVKARLAQDLKERRTHIDSARKRSPKSLAVRAALAVLLLDEGKDYEADKLFEEVLAEDPGNVDVLTCKARLALGDGLGNQALEYVDKALATRETAALYHMKSLAYRRMAKTSEEEGLLEKALAAAAEAIGREPLPEHVENYDELLQETGDPASATKALRGHFERTKLPLFGAFLARAAFKAGDYETALVGLDAADTDDAATLKAIATAHARLGDAKKARRATKKLLSKEPAAAPFVASIELWLGDAKAAEKHLGEPADIESKRLLARVHAWAGHPEGITDLLAAEARKGTRRGEDVLLTLLQARLVEAMGKSAADTLRRRIVAARRAAGAKNPVQADFEGSDLGSVKTAGWARRAVTYWRAPCGRFYEPVGDFNTTIFMEEQKPSVSQSIDAKVDCEEHGQVSFEFNRRQSEGELTPQKLVELLRGAVEMADFKPAEEAFAAACSACVDGKGTAAEAKLDEVLKIEPGFHRARIFRCVMKALTAEAGRAEAAKEAAETVASWSGDFELRRLVLFLRAFAGDGGLDAEIDALAEDEARFNERNLGDL